MSDALACGSIDNVDTLFHVRIASVFIILFTSCFGALFPVLAQRTSFINLPPKAFAAAKYFGSGVIIATGFIHLLGPGIQELGSPCLTGTWQTYQWALAISMFGVFAIFFVELVAFRVGTAKLKALGIGHDTHAHAVSGGSHAAHGPEPDHAALSDPEKSIHDNSSGELDKGYKNYNSMGSDSAIAQVIGVAILEFGVVLHSVLIGLTLAVDPDFKVLFVVIVFHQMFEGLGLGSRLALMQLPRKYNYVPIAGAALYGITTPIGIAAGLGIRTSYNPGSTTASIVSGVMDSLSSGILIYTGLVELLAHEFLFSPMVHQESTGYIVFASICVLAGAGIMALLGRWA